MRVYLKFGIGNVPERQRGVKSLGSGATDYRDGEADGAAAQAQHLSDAWLQADKLQHLLVSAALTLLAFAAASRCGARRWLRLLLSVAVSATLGVGKEVGDSLGWWYGSLSLRDLAADVGGIVGAVCILACCPECAECRPQRHQPGVQRAVRDLHRVAVIRV
ncbi:hypothetical protein AB1Y20_015420 [Prymnesium parvum]|uniref:VanZ-like domain-containing protein n=1 Tax=Prymnesium parvum TaxID=97485 RepID=A0AB34K0F2_PRYPA